MKLYFTNIYSDRNENSMFAQNFLLVRDSQLTFLPTIRSSGVCHPTTDINSFPKCIDVDFDETPQTSIRVFAYFARQRNRVQPLCWFVPVDFSHLLYNKVVRKIT